MWCKIATYAKPKTEISIDFDTQYFIKHTYEPKFENFISKIF